MRLQLGLLMFVCAAAFVGVVYAKESDTSSDIDSAEKQPVVKTNSTIEEKNINEAAEGEAEKTDDPDVTDVAESNKKGGKKNKKNKNAAKKMKAQKLKEKKQAAKASKKKDKKKKKQEKVEARKQKKMDRKSKKEEKKKERKQQRLAEKNERKALKKRNRQELRDLKKAQKKALREGTIENCQTQDDCTKGGCCIGEEGKKYCSVPRPEHFKCTKSCQCNPDHTCMMKTDTFGKCVKEEKYGAAPVV